MKESELIYDWNAIDYEIARNPSNHPHGVWFDDETLRDGLQSPSARNPEIEQKIELIDYMEKLGIQKVDLGLPGVLPRPRWPPGPEPHSSRWGAGLQPIPPRWTIFRI